MKKIILLLSLVCTAFICNAQCASVSTLAGSGTGGYADGTGTSAQFSGPAGIAVDGSGNAYVADMANNRIRKISSTGVVTTLAGSGVAGFSDGTGTSAQFKNPSGVAVDGSGNVYVADVGNHRIRKISSTGVVTTLAGSGISGYADGTGTSSQFALPYGLAVDGSGNVYVADQSNNRIRKITPAGVVTTLAGSGAYGNADGTGTSAQFKNPLAVAIDGSGTVYVAEGNGIIIRKITPAGVVTTLAGSGTNGYADGTGTSAQFRGPNGVAVDGSGTVYVSDRYNYRIRKITPLGVVTTLAGSGVAGFADSTGNSAQFHGSIGVAVDGSGNLYVGDSTNNRIRKITFLTLPTPSTGPASSTPTLCINSILPNITHATTGATGIGTSTGLPSGVSASWIANTITISGTPTVSGTFNYSIPLTGGCGTLNATGSITVKPNNTAGVASLSTVCINTPLTSSITTVGATGIGASTGLPTGTIANWSANTITISGTPTVAGTYNYNIPLTGGCGAVNATGTITVKPNNTINYYIQQFTTCINGNFGTSTLATTTGATGIGVPIGLPTGVSATWSANTITISGTPTVAGIYNYNIPLTGGCGTVNTTGTITVKPNNTAGFASSTPTLCINSVLPNITHATTVATGIGISTGLPSGVSATWSANTITISGTPTVSGTFNYSIPLTGGCGTLNATGSITVKPNNTAGPASSTPTLCINSVLPNITHTTTGATGIGTSTGLPSGVSATWSANTITISGTPAVSGIFNYSIPLTGGCGTVNATGTIIVKPNNTAGVASLSTVCINTPLTSNITTVGATGIGTSTGLPTGTIANWSANTITISGTPTVAGNYNYNIPLTGGCGAVNATGTITVKPNNTIQYYTQQITTCINGNFGTSTLATTTGATGIGLPIGLPTGISANWASNTITISGASTVSGTFNYSIPLTGGCGTVNATGTINVYSTPTASISADGTIATSTTITNGSSVQLQLNGTLNAQPNIQWTPATGISSATVANPVVYPSATTTYTASFINSNGCTQTTSFTVNVTPQPNIGNLSLSSSNNTVGLFDVITVDVQLTNATNLYSLYMKLKGNAAVSQYLDYSGYTAGTLLGTNIISTQPTVTNGVPDFGMTKVGAVPGYSGSGLFYSFRFVPKNNVVIPAGTTFCFYLDDVSSYNASGIPCGLTNQGQYCYTFTNQVAVWPGDLNKSNTVTTADILPIGYFYNSTGAARANATIQWNAQPATLWGYNRTSTNSDAYKVFADSNGDGVINNADQAAIGFNMNQVHNRMAWPAPDHFSAQAQQTLAVGNLTVTPNSTVINGAALPQTVTFTVSVNNTGGLSALYGMSVNLGFDNTVFDLTTATINYTGSIFGNVGSDCLALNYNSDNTVSVGLTRFGNAAINGQGLLFKVTLQTKTTLPNLAVTPVTAFVESANNQAGDTLVIQEAPTNNFTIINNLGLDTIKQDEFVLYPNPASDLVYLQMGANTQLAGMKIKVVNLLGQVIEELPIQNNTTELSTKNWGAAGVYFVQITNQNNQTSVTKKVIINRK